AGAAPHGGEAMASMLVRIGGWVDECRGCAGMTVAVTHPSVIRAAITYAIDAGPAAFWHLDVGPLSVTRLRSDGSRWMLRGLQA
ncbi:MAG: histidine phosphatase family protein, partial [Acidimicrobiales bacterium]